MDRQKNDNEDDDDRGRIEHAFTAAPDAARLDSAHFPFRPFGQDPSAPSSEAGTDAGRQPPPQFEPV